MVHYTGENVKDSYFIPIEARRRKGYILPEDEDTPEEPRDDE